MTRDENIFTYKNFIDYTNGESSFSFSTEKDYLQMLDMLNSMGIAHITNVNSVTITDNNYSVEMTVYEVTTTE